MSDAKSSVSQAQSYQEMGKFWDTHDVTEFWDQTAPAEFEVDIQSEVTYYPVDIVLSVTPLKKGRPNSRFSGNWVQLQGYFLR